MSALTIDGFEVPAEINAKGAKAIDAWVNAEKQRTGWVPPAPPAPAAEEEASSDAVHAAADVAADVDTASSASNNSPRRAKTEGVSKRASTEG